MEMLELLETVRAEEVSVQRLFGKDGQGARSQSRGPKYMSKLVEATRLVADVMNGRRGMHVLKEAMTTSDFPYLFGDIIDRQILAAYRETQYSWNRIAKRGRVRDFRAVKRFSTYGADQVLPAIVGEKGEYPYEAINENTPYSYALSKYGRKLKYAWEAMINDDLQALQDGPERLGRAARRSEEKFVTQMYVDASGPHASFYTVGNLNIVTGNPALSLASLQTAMQQMAAQTDENGEPIIIEQMELRVTPALEVTALNILNAMQIEMAEKGGTANRKLITANWMKSRFNVTVDYYIPIVASSANGATSWFLFGDPNNGRPALEMGFLMGHEEPEIFMKSPNATRVGGGGVDAMNGDFDTDAIEYKLRHVFGGSRMDPKMTMGSNGSGG